ncbi:MAG TPA: methyltransferase domain-containing protein [Paraburkholderia sp.]|uniref:class I SAM-dependent methyltransferase n=1 Tax=Paraburkholderia sp. TaxID=1926495 RepID=UPI002ED01E8C
MLNPTQRSTTGRLLRKVLGWPAHRFMPAAVKALILPRRALISGQTWDREYQTGTWDYLSATGELGRYSVISGYCRYLKPAARVLDVGCGAGILAEWLTSARISSYFGIDLSEVGIEKARRSNITGAQFAVANAAAFDTSQTFDVIVFNEILYYFERPDEVARRFAGFLAPGGIMIVSMWHHPEGIRTWKALKTGFEEIDRIHLVHASSRLKWNIAVLRPEKGLPKAQK